MRHLHRGTILSTAAVLAVFIGLILAPCTPVSAKNKTTTPAPLKNVVITSVDSSAQTITITGTGAGRDSTTYTIDAFTQITVEGQTGTFDQLKPGQQVVTYVERSSSALDSLVVTGSGTTPSDAPTKKKKK